MMKSPLRYPGGKSRAVKIITDRFPQGLDTLVSPFFGGGSVELSAAQCGIRVHGYDNFSPLVAFWQELLGDSYSFHELIADIREYFPLSQEQFKKYQKQLSSNTEICRRAAILFFILNRASFSGTTLSGGCIKTPSEGENARFTESSIDKLIDFLLFPRNMLSVNYSLWPDTLAKHPNQFMYLDPPYLIDQGLYGIRGDNHRDFNHLALRDALCLRSGPWLLSYNNCDAIKELYSKFRIEEVNWSKGMSNGPSNELLIRNY